MSDEIKASLVQNVIDKKFSRANSDFANLMRDKAYSAIDDFKNAFQYVAIQKKEADDRAAEKEVEKMWKEVQTNIGKFQRLFGNKNFVIVDNNDAGEDIFSKVWKRIMVLVRQKVGNHIAKRWISQELAKKARK